MGYWGWWFERTKAFLPLVTLLVLLYSGICLSIATGSAIPFIVCSILGFSIFFYSIVKESYKKYSEEKPCKKEES